VLWPGAVAMCCGQVLSSLCHLCCCGQKHHVDMCNFSWSLAGIGVTKEEDIAIFSNPTCSQPLPNPVWCIRRRGRPNAVASQ